MYLFIDTFVSLCTADSGKPSLPFPLGIELQHIHTRLMVMISPFDFLTFLNFIKKYQNLDFATTVFGANILMR